MAADGHLNFDTEIDEKGFNSGIKKLSGLAKVGLAGIGVAIGTTVAAFGTITKASLDSVASLEQNVGGIETLFKDSAQTVVDNANRAFQTAGMSANEYMQNVTSFSASLLQSVAGDTNEAARVADMAMIDMSDNANKMGTNIEDIKNAYQGFAKQNYTMLDNLKLGYGGTKTEMERLLSDAEKLTGVKYDISNLNDVYEAIHAIQENLGIAGTTALEASTTIEGSMNAAKAAFDNFLNGSGSPQALADSIAVAAGNILSALGEIVPRLMTTLPQVGSQLLGKITESLSGDGVSNLVSAGMSVIQNIVSGIMQSLPTLAGTAVGIVSSLISYLVDSGPQFLSSGFDLLSQLIDGIVQAIPEKLPKILDFVQGIGDKLAEAAPVLIRKGFELLQKLVEGIVTAIPILIAKVPKIISTFANTINDNFPTILMKGVQLLGQLVMGLIQAIPTLIANIPQIISAIVDTLMAFQWLNLGKTIITGLGNGIKAMGGFIKSAGQNILNNLKSAVLNLPSTLANLGRSAMYSLGNTISGLVSYVRSAALRIVSGIESAILGLPGKMLSIGRNIVRGLWNGISDMTGWIISKIQGFGSSVLNGIKDFFGIHSPSRVFRDQVGKMLALGLGVGFEKYLPVKEMKSGVERAIQSLKNDVALTTSVKSDDTVGKIKSLPGFFGSTDATDYDRLERIQMRAADRMAKRPIYLGTERIDKPLPKGAVPQV
jgi:phage-related protein